MVYAPRFQRRRYPCHLLESYHISTYSREANIRLFQATKNPHKPESRLVRINERKNHLTFTLTDGHLPRSSESLPV